MPFVSHRVKADLADCNKCTSHRSKVTLMPRSKVTLTPRSKVPTINLHPSCRVRVSTALVPPLCYKLNCSLVFEAGFIVGQTLWLYIPILVYKIITCNQPGQIGLRSRISLLMSLYEGRPRYLNGTVLFCTSERQVSYLT